MLHFITNYNNIIKFRQMILHDYQKKAAPDRILTMKSLCEYIIPFIHMIFVQPFYFVSFHILLSSAKLLISYKNKISASFFCCRMFITDFR